jgi:hypothetical protein
MVDCRASGSHSSWPAALPLSASGLQLDHASAFVFIGMLNSRLWKLRSTPGKHLVQQQAEIERIEEAVSRVRFPLTFSDRCIICAVIVRRKITSHVNAPGRIAAE